MSSDHHELRHIHHPHKRYLLSASFPRKWPSSVPRFQNSLERTLVWDTNRTVVEWEQQQNVVVIGGLACGLLNSFPGQFDAPPRALPGAWSNRNPGLRLVRAQRVAHRIADKV